MYIFSKRLKSFAVILMVLGILGIGYGFFTSPKSVQEIAVQSHHHTAQVSAESHADHNQDGEVTDHDQHLEHQLHQLQNRPWTALYVAALFFAFISLGTLAFYAINYVSQAGWSPVLFRVMEGITAYLLPGMLAILIVLASSGLHLNHLFVWMDSSVVEHDTILQGKQGYLNVPFFLIRACVYVSGWVLYRYLSRKFSLAQDTASDNKNFVKNFRLSAGFLVFFLVTESMVSWDWVMSVEPHWFSTLFGWYVFASMLVSAVTVIALVTIYLKSQGYLEYVNDSHIHDLAKFMFGLSIFWTYLWFSQFLLYWYSNIPEEITYYVTRLEQYAVPFLSMVVLNFLFPLLVLINTDYKRVNSIVVTVGLVILVGHYLDFYNMIAPSTVGDQWFIGTTEIASVLFFLGLFIYVVFGAIAKAPLLAKRNPFIEESKHYHY